MTEELPRRLDRLMREAGYNPRSLSLAAALGATAVRDILEGRIASPRYATLEALAKVLGVRAAFLASGEGPATGADADLATPRPGSKDLPVYGAAQGGPTGAMSLSSEPIQWVMRPDPLIAVPAGYGVYVVGESMSPAYEQGDIALVHPSQPYRREADVVLIRQEPDGTRHALIKRLIGWSDSVWKVRQYNPFEEYELPRAVWSDVQAIVGKYNAR